MSTPLMILRPPCGLGLILTAAFADGATPTPAEVVCISRWPAPMPSTNLFE